MHPDESRVRDSVKTDQLRARIDKCLYKLKIIQIYAHNHLHTQLCGLTRKKLTPTCFSKNRQTHGHMHAALTSFKGRGIFGQILAFLLWTSFGREQILWCRRFSCHHITRRKSTIQGKYGYAKLCIVDLAQGNSYIFVGWGWFGGRGSLLYTHSSSGMWYHNIVVI